MKSLDDGSKLRGRMILEIPPGVQMTIREAALWLFFFGVFATMAVS